MEFENLNQYYEYLETDHELRYLDLNTYKYITALRDKLTDEGEKKICSYELYFIDFSIDSGILVPKLQSGGHSYPTLNLFDDDFSYIINRANSTINPKYKSKYNHLLWLSPKKHIDYAKLAIENYLLFLQNSSVSAKDNLQGRSFANYFKNLFVLSQTINFKKDETVNYFISLLGSDTISSFTKYSLMEFIIVNGKKIDTSITQKFFDYCQEAIKKIDRRILENYLKLLVILSQKLNISASEFHEKLGDYHIEQLKTEKRKSFIAHHYYSQALAEYKKANNKEKIESTAVLLEQSKKYIDLKKVSIEIEDEEINKVLNEYWDFIKSKLSELVENHDSTTIYSYLIVEGILPKAEKLGDEVRPAMLDLVSTMVFDINKNVNKKRSGGLNTYSLHINNFTIRHIWLLFSEGIKSGKVSFESLMDYLKNHSWYGNDFTYLDANEERQGFNWIELLSPSLQSFFIQNEIDFNTKGHHAEGYILAIDSLVLKFEGLLREFSRMIGAQTVEIKDNGTEERISFDKLLDNDKLKALIPEDDIAFFKYLFTSEGMNLRNNVAHCFFNTQNYNSAIMLLLLVALLRLGNFELKANEDSND